MSAVLVLGQCSIHYTVSFDAACWLALLVTANLAEIQKIITARDSVGDAHGEDHSAT